MPALMDYQKRHCLDYCWFPGLVPANLQQLNESSQEKLLHHYSPDLPSLSRASLELEL